MTIRRVKTVEYIMLEAEIKAALRTELVLQGCEDIPEIDQMRLKSEDIGGQVVITISFKV